MQVNNVEIIPTKETVVWTGKAQRVALHHAKFNINLACSVQENLNIQAYDISYTQPARLIVTYTSLIITYTHTFVILVIQKVFCGWGSSKNGGIILSGSSAGLLRRISLFWGCGTR